MKKLGILLLTFAITVASFAGCERSESNQNANENTQTQDIQTVKSENAQKEQMLQLFPQKAGTEWVYNGTAEYGHEMRIDSINQLEGNKIQYLVSGKVFDMSDGESKKDFSVYIEYEFSGTGIREIIKKGETMPHKIKELYIIKAPLEKGNTWTESVILDGTAVTLEGKIIDVYNDQETGAKTYKVEYTAPFEGMPDNVYRETRVYQEGKGLISFENTYAKGDIFNYRLYIIN